MALRVRPEGAARGDRRPRRLDEDREAEDEGIAQRIGRETLRPQPAEVLGIAGRHGVLEARPEDVRDIGLFAGPPDAHRALAVHPRVVAMQGGHFEGHPLPDQGRIRIDREPGRVAGRLCAEQEMAGGFVEVCVVGGVGGEGVGGLRGDGGGGEGGGEEEGEESCDVRRVGHD